MAVTFLAIIIGVGLVHSCICREAPIIAVENGKVSGTVEEAREHGRHFYAYKGIPFAKSPNPNDSSRFEPPQKQDNWTEVLDGESYGNACLQWDPHNKEVYGEEDCLYLNVFTPMVKGAIGGDFLPVIVFIHGGGFMRGKADIYSPEYFMDHDVVFVTFNYRLGVFGFLSTDDSVVSGNGGLKDQVFALQWVQRNIIRFAGDPKHVTIAGQGSGAISAHLLTLSPMAKGLFRRAIMHSGTALDYNAIQTRPLEAAQRLARHIKCDQVLNNQKDVESEITLRDVLNNTHLLVRCLKAAHANTLTEAQQDAFSLFSNPLSQFGPTLENPHQLNLTKGTIFLSEHPFSILVANNQTKMPLLVGFNEYEGLDITNQILHEKEMVTLINEHWEEIVYELLRYPRSRTDFTKQIKKFYFLKNDTDLNSTNDTMNKPTEPPSVTPQPSLTTTDKPHNHSTSPTIVINDTYYVPVPVNTTQQHNTTAVSSTTAVLPDDNEEEPTINFKSQYKSFTNLITDRFHTSSMFESVRLHLNNSRIYVYENLYPSEHPLYVTEEHKEKPSIKKVFKDKLNKLTGKKANLTQQLVGFGDDLLLLFKSPEYEIKDNMKDYETSKEQVKLWVQFAKNDTIMTYFKHAWTPVTGTVENYSLMRFGTTPELSGMRQMSESLKKRLKFWNSRLYFPLINQ